MTTLFGKYRGKVVNNLDPLRLGRLITLVPAVSDLHLSWAMPCVPYAGKDVGFFALPPLEANVWVEFEGGDPNYPIWTGCFWGVDEIPTKSAVPTTKMIKTETFTFEVDEQQTAVSLETQTSVGPVKLALVSDGITLTIGNKSRKISL